MATGKTQKRVALYQGHHTLESLSFLSLVGKGGQGEVKVWQCEVALGDRFWLFIQTLKNDKKPFNSIFNSKTILNYSFKEFIHSKTKSNYSFKELFIHNGQNNPAWEKS